MRMLHLRESAGNLGAFFVLTLLLAVGLGQQQASAQIGIPNGNFFPPDLRAPFCEPVEDPDVRTQGFWKRICQKPHPSGEHENLPEYVDCVNQAPMCMDVVWVETLCERLNPDPKNDKCAQAEAQYMALLLNVCSERVATCNCVVDPDLGETNVGEVIQIIDFLLSDPDRTFKDCVLVQSLASSINEGLTLVDCP